MIRTDFTLLKLFVDAPNKLRYRCVCVIDKYKQKFKMVKWSYLVPIWCVSLNNIDVNNGD